MIMNIDIGTSRNRSDVVRSSCLRSLRVKADPFKVRTNRRRAVRMSAAKS